MPIPLKYFEYGSLYFITSRTEEGLPFKEAHLFSKGGIVGQTLARACSELLSVARAPSRVKMRGGRRSERGASLSGLRALATRPTKQFNANWGSQQDKSSEHALEFRCPNPPFLFSVQLSLHVLAPSRTAPYYERGILGSQQGYEQRSKRFGKLFKELKLAS